MWYIPKGKVKYSKKQRVEVEPYVDKFVYWFLYCVIIRLTITTNNHFFKTNYCANNLTRTQIITYQH